ncbi:Protein of unknown function [Bacillus cereus]|nr:Protein of unknown function [Bacillus cereus]
MEVVET